MQQTVSVDGQVALSGSGLYELGFLLPQFNAYMIKKTAHILGRYSPLPTSCYRRPVSLLLPSGC